MSRDKNNLVTTVHRERSRVLSTGFLTFESILYFGNWSNNWANHFSNTQYNAFEFSFKGSTVKWIGSKRKNHGYADFRHL